MMDVLQGAGSAPTVLMLGHNPGIAEFADRLLRQPPGHPQFFHYPTCATLVAEFSGQDWAEVGFGTGTALDFAIPHDQLNG